MAAWDRQPKEPPKAYAHFCTYRDLGPERSLPKVSQLSAVSLPRLKDLSDQYGWVARCDQWDAHVEAIHQRAYLTEAAKKGRQRAQAFTALLGKSLEALRGVDVEKVPLAQIAAAMKVAVEGLRLEEGLETARLTMEVQDAKLLLSRLPAEVRSPLLRALKEHADPGRDPVGAPLGLSGGTETGGAGWD
jgi:hypothetical protein